MAIVRFINATTDVEKVKPTAGFSRPDIRQEVLIGLTKYFYIAGGIGALIAIYDLSAGIRSTGKVGESLDDAHADSD